MNRRKNRVESHSISRRRFVGRCAAGAAALAAGAVLQSRARGAGASTQPTARGPAGRTIPLDEGFLFGGPFRGDATAASFDDSGFARVNLPHCVAKLSWQNWDPAAWQGVWLYRRHFDLPADCKGLRVFLHFDGVMVGTTPTINNVTLQKHLGGYLPSRYEITEYVKQVGNVLAVEVDSRWSNVPPEGSAKGSRRVDYLEAGGIYRGVRLQAAPAIFIRDVFAKPVNVLESSRRVEMTCTLDAASVPRKPLQLQAELKRGGEVVSRARQAVSIDERGTSEVKLTLADLGNVALWDVRSPHLYDVVVMLLADERPVHDYATRIGLREARFELDGFFLNGRRVQLFGLDRHEIFPYVGGAMPNRVLRRDAHILRREFNCNVVRCSHYPQSEAFLDACDELGLMVWEETPGWGYLGNEAWKELLVRDVRDMIVRDRNHPSIVIWGTRANESANDVPLYRRTRELARSLDDSRPSSGSMTSGTRRNWKRDWHEDVFAFDDYHAERDGTVGIEGPTPGVPYLLSEAVGQFNYSHPRKGFDSYYRRAGDVEVQQVQALRHAQAHSKAAANPRICGVIAWCAFDYASQVNAYKNVKTPGVADVFRIPKLGASFYQAQTEGDAAPIIQPSFYWDFVSQPRGPAKGAAIFSNCDRLEVFVNGRHHASAQPDTARYPHLRHAPFFVDLDLDGSSRPDLRIDGYRDNRLALSRSFSSDPSQDQFVLKADDDELVADGSDATRLVFKVADRFGADRLDGRGDVTLHVTGPGEVVGDNPFALADSGGVGAVWIKAQAGPGGTTEVSAVHSTLGKKSVAIRARPA